MYRFHAKKQMRERSHCLLLLSQGYSPGWGQQVLMRSLKTPYNWVNRWLEQGLAGLYFCNETGFNQIPCVPYAWQERGQPLVLVPAKGRNYSVLGIMGRDSSLQAYGTQGSINPQVAVACIEDFCRRRDDQAGDRRA